LRRLETGVARDALLAVHGVGPETADSILLYAFEKPVFVVDAYTRRVLERHRLIPPRRSYEEIRAFLESSLPRDTALWNDFHAQLVAVGHHHCAPSPRCAGCPLEALIPAQGIRRERRTARRNPR
jgi:endonuclease-3 related protein